MGRVTTAKGYPKQWPEIRRLVIQRAGNKCERCGVVNHSAGYRDTTGRFHPEGGTLHHDAAGRGELSYAEARELVRHANECCDGCGPNGEKGIVIVLTVAHYPDFRPENCSPDNLLLTCQRCHLRLDQQMHLRARRQNRERARLRLQQPLDLTDLR